MQNTAEGQQRHQPEQKLHARSSELAAYRLHKSHSWKQCTGAITPQRLPWYHIVVVQPALITAEVSIVHVETRRVKCENCLCMKSLRTTSSNNNFQADVAVMPSNLPAQRTEIVPKLTRTLYEESLPKKSAWTGSGLFAIRCVQLDGSNSRASESRSRIHCLARRVLQCLAWVGLCGRVEV